MFAFLKALHFVGIAMCLGSLLAVGVIGLLVTEVIEVALIAHQRRLLQILTWALAVPGMWLTGASGLLLSLLRGDAPLIPRWLRLKQLLFILVLFNSTFLFAPLVDHLATLAAEGRLAGVLPPSYADFALRELVLAGLNVTLLLGAMALAVGRYRPRLAPPPEPPSR